jgi:hypothetical protein
MKRSPVRVRNTIARRPGTGTRDCYGRPVRVVATESAVELVREGGGRLFVWLFPGRT